MSATNLKQTCFISALFQM